MSDQQPAQQPAAEPARSFGSVAEAYHRGRPSYPVEAVEWLLGAEPRIVLELGAGTGKLSAVMVDAGHAVHATEPDPAMLDVLQREVPGCSSKQADAEDVPANDNSVDVVVVAQAFHWFDHERALAEIARILRPDGTLALVWNSPDLRIPWVRRLFDLLGHQDQNTSSVEHVVNSPLFGFVEERTFSTWQDVNRETIVDLALSRSSIASLGADARADKLAEVVDFYDQFGRGMDGMQVPYRVQCFKATVVEPLTSTSTGGIPAVQVESDDRAPDAGDAEQEQGSAEGPAGRGDEGGDDMLLIDFR
ncbi:MAG: class I SAM-dependent methyltransferase [Nocardioides sp.]|uniref:class I SAM-dependent methyltransferase n=1 Tax=Nocardioides sp. TaxID=35761 RepID=UPI003F0E394C